jgi:hypothetical protein
MTSIGVLAITTQEIADCFYYHVQRNEWNKIRELFAWDAVSIEPRHAITYRLYSVIGLNGIKEKAKKFKTNIEEIHSEYYNSPEVEGNFFSIAMGLDVTIKDTGRFQIYEIAVYEVRDGKIIKEQFLF